MSLRINDIAPDFTAETTHGTIHFHEWIGDNWAVLFSHPKDFTPVCTTELGAVAALEEQFAARGAKVIGLSVDPVSNHGRWAKDIKDVSGSCRKVSPDRRSRAEDCQALRYAACGCWGLLRRPHAGQQRPVRAVFVIGPDKRVKLTLDVSDDYRPQFRRNYPRARFDPAHCQTSRRNAGQLEAGRRGHHHGRRIERRGRQDLPRLQDCETLSADGGSTAVTFL